jgi:Fe-S cluster assembly scaffold protein SufB
MIQINYTAVVELIALENATIKYSTVQNGIQDEFGKEEYTM